MHGTRKQLRRAAQRKDRGDNATDTMLITLYSSCAMSLWGSRALASFEHQNEFAQLVNSTDLSQNAC